MSPGTSRFRQFGLKAYGCLSTPRATNRQTAENDVLVDGRIVTGEDDISAREMGRRIVQVLSQAKEGR